MVVKTRVFKFVFRTGIETKKIEKLNFWFTLIGPLCREFFLNRNLFQEWLPDQFVLLNQMKRQSHSPKNTFYLIVGRQISFQWLQIQQVVLVRTGLQVVWIPVFHTYVCQFDLHQKNIALKKYEGNKLEGPLHYAHFQTGKNCVR